MAVNRVDAVVTRFSTDLNRDTERERERSLYDVITDYDVIEFSNFLLFWNWKKIFFLRILELWIVRIGCNLRLRRVEESWRNNATITNRSILERLWEKEQFIMYRQRSKNIIVEIYGRDLRNLCLSSIRYLVLARNVASYVGQWTRTFSPVTEPCNDCSFAAFACSVAFQWARSCGRWGGGRGRGR